MKGDAAEAEVEVEENYGNCLSSLADEGSIESHKYYLARRTILEMLKDRGFAVPSVEIQLSLQEFRDKHGSKPSMEDLKFAFLHKDDPSIKVHVLFHGNRAVKVYDVRNIAGLIVNKDASNRLILVVEKKITSQAMKALDLFKIKVEIFQIEDLFVNITKHELKPKHQVLSQEEKENLLIKYSIEEKQLPRMSQKDAIARYYGLEKGEVVKVSYTGELTQLHVTYRCVW